MTEENKNGGKPTELSGINEEELVDISRIRIDSSKPIEERRRQYLKQVGDPYLVKVGDTVVRLSFANNGISFEEAFENLLSMS